MQLDRLKKHNFRFYRQDLSSCRFRLLKCLEKLRFLWDSGLFVFLVVASLRQRKEKERQILRGLPNVQRGQDLERGRAGRQG